MTDVVARAKLELVAQRQLTTRMAPVIACRSALLTMALAGDNDTAAHLERLYADFRAMEMEEDDNAGASVEGARKRRRALRLAGSTIGDIRGIDVGHVHRAPAFIVAVINRLMKSLGVRKDQRAKNDRLTKEAVKMMGSMRRIKLPPAAPTASASAMVGSRAGRDHTSSRERGVGYRHPAPAGDVVETRSCNNCGKRGHLRASCTAPRTQGPARPGQR